MTNTKNTKRALLSSVLALFLCFAMLLGTTFAWFTDSVTSANNIIKSGTLNVEMYYADGKLAVPADDSTDWKNAQGVALYTAAQLWEPGYTDAKHIKISNEGTLALKYQLAIIPTGEVSELADVIDVYLYQTEGVLDNAKQVATRDDIDATMKVGTLADVISKGIVQGNLAADTDYTTTIVLKMQEGAGNEYQNKSIGDDFTIQLLATQLNSEKDSFDTDYDKDAWVTGMKVYTASDLQAAINAGETNIQLMNDITLDETIVIPASTTRAIASTVIDLNGKTITGNVGRDADGNRVHVIVNNGNAVIKNGVITSAGVNGGSAIYNADGATLTVENVTLNGAPQEGSTWPSYTVNNYGTLTVSDSSIYGVQGIIATNNTANTTVNNVIAYRDGWSSGHVFYNSSTAKVTINGGTYTNDGNGVDGTMIYGGETVVNGGTFIVKEGAYFALCSGSKLTVNGGDFSNIKSCLAWGGTMTISGGTFGFNPTTYVADGYKAVDNGNGTYTVIFPQESFDSLLENAVAGGAVELPAGTYTFPADKLKEGVTINCAPSTVFKGTSGLDINGATVVGGTFSNDSGSAASGTINGTFKNCSFTGSNALRWCYAGENVVFENCVFSGDVYGVHFDGGANEVIFRNCTFSGFNAFGGEIKNLVLDGCTFKANDTSNYNGVNLWGSAELIGCTFIFDGSVGYEWVDAMGTNATYSFTNCVVTDGTNEKEIETVVGNYGEGNTIVIDGVQVVASAEQLVAAINAGATKVYLNSGDYALRFTNNTNFNVDGMTLKGLGDVKLTISSSEAWYGRVQGSNVTFENIHFTSAVGATGKATYNNCAFDSWTICASSNKEETYFNNCAINGCLNTSTDFSSGDVYVKNCTVVKAEYSGSMTVNFESCKIGEVIIWNSNTNFTNCDVTTMNLENVSTATVKIDGVVAK